MSGMQFEVGNILLRFDEVGLFIHNSRNQGSIQLTPAEGNMFVEAWALSQGALSAHVNLHGHLSSAPTMFIPSFIKDEEEEDDNDNEHDT